jgi:hypothetical protein
VREVQLDGGVGRRLEEPMSSRELTMIDVEELLPRWTAATARGALLLG